MSAIRFEAIVENDAIQIPERFRAAVNQGKVQVMLLTDSVREPVDTTRAGTLTPNDFTQMNLSTKDFRFDREKANARR